VTAAQELMAVLLALLALCAPLALAWFIVVWRERRARRRD